MLIDPCVATSENTVKVFLNKENGVSTFETRKKRIVE